MEETRRRGYAAFNPINSGGFGRAPVSPKKPLFFGIEKKGKSQSLIKKGTDSRFVNCAKGCKLHTMVPVQLICSFCTSTLRSVVVEDRQFDWCFGVGLTRQGAHMVRYIHFAGRGGSVCVRVCLSTKANQCFRARKACASVFLDARGNRISSHLLPVSSGNRN